MKFSTVLISNEKDLGAALSRWALRGWLPEGEARRDEDGLVYQPMVSRI